jgi:signal transduction histidine kinase/DNA-binding response OmpR family regulator
MAELSAQLQCEPAPARGGGAREAGGMAEHIGSPRSGAQRRGDALAFLQGGGELGTLIRAKDWSQTPLGPPESWPQSLKTTLGIVLNSRYPMFVFWGPELIKIYNDGYRPITGHKHPWALGRPAREVWPEIWRDIEPLVARALAGDPTYSDDLMLFMERSGFREEVYFTFSYSPVPDESGGVGGMFCACTETTARVIGERRLRTLRDLAASPADARTVDAACTLSIEVLGANAADVPFALIYLQQDAGPARLVAGTGLPPGSMAAPLQLTDDAAWPIRRVAGTREPELIPSPADRFGPIAAGPWPEPPTSAMVLPIVDRGLDCGVGALVLGLSARRPFDGDYRRWFELVAAQIGASITNARAAEDERRRADVLADLDRAKTAFFSNVSHEFRTPLTLMLGPLEQALAADGLPAPARESLDLARRNSQRLLKLVNTLLDFSRLEAGRLQAATEPADLGAVTAEIAGAFRSTIEAAGLRYDVETSQLTDPVPVDREMWEKIVLNLVSNAFKFTLTGHIAVRLAREGEQAVLTVSDTGIGIPATQLPHVFERFHRVRGAGGRSYEGSGIGLALVRELVRLHQGDVSIASTPGAGSTFRVTLPIGEARVPAPPAEARDAGPRPAGTAHGDTFVEEAARWLASGAPASPDGEQAGQPRILLADDNADMRDHLARLLAPSCRVEAVADGAAALDAIRAHPPDLILADMMMPRLDGLELLRAVRSDPALRRIPVILVSARAGEEARVQGMGAGADDYLFKPFGARELLARVAAALQLARVRREGEERLARANRDLRDRVAELETLLSVIPVGIGIALDRECRNVQVNPALGALLGLSPGQNASKTAPEAERPTSFRVLDLEGNEVPGDQLPLQVAAREGREVRELQLDVVHDDGRVMHLLEYAAPLLDEHGTPRGSVGAFVDMTHRRRAERRDSFLVALDDAVRASDDPRAMLVAACRLLGAEIGAARCSYAAVDTDGDEFTVVHEHPFDATETTLRGAWTLSGFSDAFAGQLRAGRTLVVTDYAIELPEDAATFAHLGIRASVTAATQREGRLVAMLSVHHAAPRRWRADEIELVEITANRCWESIARARAARALEASERRYRVVADAMPQLVWTAGPDGAIDYYSARARAYEGIQVGEGNDWQPMVHPDDVVPTLEAWTRAMRERTPYAFEHRLKMATGEFRWHLSRAEPVQLEGTTARDRFRWIGTATDVHELRLSQERLRVQEEALRDVDRRKDEFIAILAHELRNPLAPLRTALELLRLSSDPGTAVGRVRPMMERQVTQMVRLIDDLLDVSRITSGKIQLQPEPTLVADLVRNALEGHRAAIDAGDLTVQIALPDEPLYVSADPARFVQIVSNLLHNAIKFTDPGGSVTIAGEAAGPDRLARELRLSVSDTGAGIAADAMPHIFALFAQAPQPGSPARVGLGIGLALARRLAELHGGRLDAASEGPGRGATFTLSVPLLPLDLETAATTSIEAPPPDLSRCRLVVVDDNQDAADALAIALAGCGGDVRTAYDGDAGLRAVEAFAPDAVLLDIGMPGLDGYAVCRAIRAGAHRRALVVALTGFGQAHDKARALAAGFDAHLTKPTELAAVFALLRPLAAGHG